MTEPKVIKIQGIEYKAVQGGDCCNCAFINDHDGCVSAVEQYSCASDKGDCYWVKKKEGQSEEVDTPLAESSQDVRSYNVGNSNYAKHKIQPWDIWLEYNLNPWDADIIKRVLRHKEGDSRKMDYEKIIHICQERIRQLDLGLE